MTKRFDTRIFFCGDLHGEMSQLLQTVEEHSPEAVVILGDVMPSRPLGDALADLRHKTDVWWIPGNHDTDNDLLYDRLWRSTLASHNLSGHVREVAGVRVAGLGGVFRGQIWMPPSDPNFVTPSDFIRKVGRQGTWRGGVPRRHRSSIFLSAISTMLNEGPADVLVTHEAPGCHRKGFPTIDDVAIEVGAKKLFHGHQHEDHLYELEFPGYNYHGILMRGVGLYGIMDLAGRIVVPGYPDTRDAQGRVRPIVPSQRRFRGW